MKIIHILLIITYIFINQEFTFAANIKPEYSAKNIPDKLKKNAIAVIRKDETVFEILSEGTAKLKTTYIVTIFNEKADYLSNVKIFYDKYQKITDLEGAVYDKDGKEIKKIKKDRIIDMNISSSGILYSDNRVKFTQLKYHSYPYTVYYTYEKDIKGLLFMPEIYFQSDNEISVENASFMIITNKNTDFRYLEKNLKNQVVKTNIEDKTYYKWKESDIETFEPEPHSIEIQELLPRVLVAPNNFVYDEFPGNMQTWENLGKWHNAINKDRDVLSDAEKQQIRDITKNATTEKQKVKILYEYLQSQTRYVAISYGIGGFQPIEASKVHEFKYGDCKALSFYMKTLLKTVGINSYYSPILAGTDVPHIIDDFPSKQTNHIILCVPIDKDTIWLECTSKDSPMGYLGSFTGDRKALVVEENGGILRQTPSYDYKTNHKTSYTNITLTEDGAATCSSTYSLKGVPAEIVPELQNASLKDRQEWLYDQLDYPTTNIRGFDINYNKSNSLPEASIVLGLQIYRYCTKSQSRLFVNPVVLHKHKSIPKEIESRKNKVKTQQSEFICDTVTISIPAGYSVEYLPENISLKSKFGEYVVKSEQQKDKILYIRSLTTFRKVEPAEAYKELRDFYKQVVDNDKKDIILKKSI